MHGFHFLHPSIFISLLVTLPVCAAIWYGSYVRALRSRDAYGERRLLTRYADLITLNRQTFRLALCLLVILCVTLSAAGPAFKGMPQHVRAGSMQVIAVINVDPAMAAEDYRGEIPGRADTMPGPNGTRVQEAEYQVLHNLMPAIKGNKLGIVTYMGLAFVQANPTDDFDALKFIIDAGWITAGYNMDGKDIGDAPCCGDYVHEGLNAALEAFKRTGDDKTDKVIVYFGHGGFDDTDAEIQASVQKLNAAHVRLIVVGTGKDEPIPVPIYDEKGFRQKYINVAEPQNPKSDIQFDGSNVGLAHFRESRLQMLAGASDNGQYIHITNGAQKIDFPSALVPGGDKTQMIDDDVYWVPLSIGILLLGFLAIQRRHNRTP